MKYTGFSESLSQSEVFRKGLDFFLNKIVTFFLMSRTKD